MTALSPDDRPAWHALDADEAARRLAAGREGLSSEEAARRRGIYGPNRLPPPYRRGPLARFLLQFHNILIYVLLAAGVVTVLLGHFVDAGVIFGVVLINAVIGFIQEGKAEQALDAIRGMLSPTAIALRDGHRVTLPVEELVPGDVVLLQSGDRVPADLRLFRVRNLRIEEAALTGESVPVEKSVAAVADEAPLGDRSGMAYSGTLVAAGQGSGLVVETGSRTEIGRISAMLSEVTTLTTPLLRQMAVFGRWLTAAILALSAATFAFGTIIHGYSADEMFLAAVGLAVAAIPEGLPAIMTITLAIGVQRMARRNAIIRRLPAVETLGSVTVICSDKTGTLTRNEMAARSVATAEDSYQVSGVGYCPAGTFTDAGGRTVAPEERPTLVEVARGAALCNDAELREVAGDWVLSGDPTEGALLALAAKAGLDVDEQRRVFPRVDAIPFESEHRFMATLHHDHHGHAFAFVKGAPERLLGMCNRQRREGEDEVIDLPWWHARLDEMASRGERLIAVAFRPMPADRHELTFADVEGGLTLLGVLGLIDPPRDEAVTAIARVREAGIRVKMITGDHALTARAIARQLGLPEGPALTGADLDRLDDGKLKDAVAATDVFARTAPEHKLRLVKALQADDHVVAMTGDGVNDAPALKRADVGVAMGRKGTEAAKEAAEMVLADDNFASIGNAVEEGRTVYDNLKKAILFILPTNGGEALVLMAAIVIGLALPITPKQILWVNMITAVTLALALAFEPAEPGIMRRPPRRPDEPLLSAFLVWRVVFVSLLLLAAVLGLFLWQLAAGASEAAARTVAVNALVMGEIAYLWNTRHLTASVLNREGMFGSRPVLIAVALLAVFQMLFTYAPPMQLLFDTVAIGLAEWGVILAAGAAVLLLVEAEKRIFHNHRNRRVGP